MAIITSVDKSGRLVLPKKIREKLGLSGGCLVVVEVEDSSVVLRRSSGEKSPSKAISKMNLPVGPWDQIEREIEEGAVKEQP